MKSHSQTEIFSEKEIRCLKLSAAIVKELPDHDRTGGFIRCHEVARIVGSVLAMEVCDGFYGFVDHSWLWTTQFSHAHMVGRIGLPNILDPYCVGQLPQVRLLDSSVTSLPHVGWAYRPAAPRTDIDEQFVEDMILHVIRKLNL